MNQDNTKSLSASRQIYSFKINELVQFFIIKSGAFIGLRLSKRLAYFCRGQVLIRLSDAGILYITERLPSVIGVCDLRHC